MSTLISFATWMISRVVMLWIRTLRVTIDGPSVPDGRPLVYAFFHGHQMGLLRYNRPTKVVVLTSLSRDGSFQSKVLAAFGFDIVRGSTSRGGSQGLMALVRRIRQGASAAVAVDGPRGPLGQVKPGVAFAALVTRGVVIPISCAAKQAVRFSKSWDQFMLPLPWTRVILLRGEPIEVPINGGKRAIENARSEIEDALHDLERRAEACLQNATKITREMR